MIGRRLVQVLSAVSDLDLNAGTLRHAGAQRLVDAGASKEELAAFMGHSDVNTGQVYFTTSANQAELLNRALGASPTYIALAQLATRRSITPQELADLKGDQQVAGVPHGIPITGIGGCQSGQAACPYNPIMACYGCDRFLPVRDISVHHGVLRDFRAIVKSFHDASRGDTRSPTFVQLTRAVRDVQNTIAELDAEVHND